MDVKVYGERYLIANNYDKIKIYNSSGDIVRGNIVIKIESNYEKENNALLLPKDEIIKAFNLDGLSEYEKIEKVISSFLESNIDELNNCEKIEKIVSIFLKNNTINVFNANSHNSPFEKRFDFSIRATNGKELEFDSLIDRNSYLKSAFINAWKEIVVKYEKDCMKFMEKNKDKKIYCLVNNFYSRRFIDETAQYPSFLNTYQVAPLGSIFTLYPFFPDFEDEKGQEVVYIKDGFTNKCQLFKNRLKIEQEKAYLEIVDVKESIFIQNTYTLKVICNDCIFILKDMTSFMFEKINNIIEQHNQSIDMGKRLLKMVEKNGIELW